MRTLKLITILLAIAWSIAPAGAVWSAPDADDDQTDSGKGLPPEFAKNYMISRSSMSRDEKFALIYPTREFSESKEARNLLVALKPFRVLETLPTREPYFDGKSNSSLGAEWSEDGTMVLITLDMKWGPADVWLVELSDDKVKRMTNLLDKARELLRPKFRAAKLKPYNSTTEFIFLQEEGGACMFDENRQVRVYCRVTNDPKGVSKRPWRVVIDAMWDVGQAKFVSQKIRPATKENDEG
jgi:hypothetical protein